MKTVNPKKMSIFFGLMIATSVTFAVGIPKVELLRDIAKRILIPIAETKTPKLPQLIAKSQFQEAALAAHSQKKIILFREIEKAVSDELLNQPKVNFFRSRLLGSEELWEVALQGGTKGLFKPSPEFWKDVNQSTRDISNYRAEIAAYEMSKKLDWGLVPVTVEREFDGMLGSLQVFVHQDQSIINKDYVRLTNIFDFLINNRDRNSRNFLVFQNRIVAIDHGMSFIPVTTRIGTPAPMLEQLEIPKSLQDLLMNLLKLDNASIRTITEGVASRGVAKKAYLDDDVVLQVTLRRDMLIKYFRLAAKVAK